MNEHSLNEDSFLKLTTTGKTACLINWCTIHIHQFVVGIPTGNSKLNKLRSGKLKDEQAILQNLKTIFRNEYSMLR